VTFPPREAVSWCCTDRPRWTGNIRGARTLMVREWQGDKVMSLPQRSRPRKTLRNQPFPDRPLKNGGSSGRNRDTVWSMTAFLQRKVANSAYIVIYSPKTPRVLSRVRSPWRPYHGRCRIDTMSPPPRARPCRGSRDNRQSATVSPRLHVQRRPLSGQGHSQFELATLHLSAAHQVLNFTLRCNPTCFRNLRIAILKRSSFNSGVMAVLPDQAGKD